MLSWFLPYNNVNQSLLLNRHSFKLPFENCLLAQLWHEICFCKVGEEKKRHLFFFFFGSVFFYFILFFNFTILYWFCHISTWIRHRYTCVPHPETSSLLPPHTILLSRPSAPAPSIQYHASNLDWRLVSYMILFMFQCHSPKSSHPLPLPQSPPDCSIHWCLFCCLIYRVIVTIFLNSIYMH